MIFLADATAVRIFTAWDVTFSCPGKSPLAHSDVSSLILSGLNLTFRPNNLLFTILPFISNYLLEKIYRKVVDGF